MQLQPIILIAIFGYVFVTTLVPIQSASNGLEFMGPTEVGNNVISHGDGTWEAFSAVSREGRVEIRSKRSKDFGRSWSEPTTAHTFSGEGFSGCIAILDRRQEVQLFFMRLRTEGTGKQVAIDRFIDVWHMRSSDNRRVWSDPQRIFQGYTGSVQMALRLRSGRMLLPLGVWVPGRAVAPPTGSHYSTTIYSDDDGATWTQSTAQLTAPCHLNYNGNNYGACEPYVVERANDVWMLIRSQDGYLYESTSPDGAAWSKAVRAPFASSNSPAGVINLPDGRIVVVWNNCQTPPRVDGQGVYGGRDALHAAISEDGGQTWRGCREIYLDRMRDDSPPDFGDRGTAYPFLMATNDGRVGVVSGQGAGRRALVILDPTWLLESHRTETFDKQLENWSVFSAFGPARRYWRERAPGARLVDHPEQTGSKALLVSGHKSRPPDGAVWNFPASRKGQLILKGRLQSEFGGISISLTDRFFDPTDDSSQAHDAFRLQVPAEAALGSKKLSPEQWFTLQWQWNCESNTSSILVDGEVVLQTSSNRPPLHGLSYLRIRSTATSEQLGGLMVASVSMEGQ